MANCKIETTDKLSFVDRFEHYNVGHPVILSYLSLSSLRLGAFAGNYILVNLSVLRGKYNKKIKVLNLR